MSSMIKVASRSSRGEAIPLRTDQNGFLQTVAAVAGRGNFVGRLIEHQPEYSQMTRNVFGLRVLSQCSFGGESIKIVKMMNGHIYVATDKGIYKITYQCSEVWFASAENLGGRGDIIGIDLSNDGKLYAANTRLLFVFDDNTGEMLSHGNVTKEGYIVSSNNISSQSPIYHKPFPIVTSDNKVTIPTPVEFVSLGSNGVVLVNKKWADIVFGSGVDSSALDISTSSRILGALSTDADEIFVINRNHLLGITISTGTVFFRKDLANTSGTIVKAEKGHLIYSTGGGLYKLSLVDARTNVTSESVISTNTTLSGTDHSYGKGDTRLVLIGDDVVFIDTASFNEMFSIDKIAFGSDDSNMSMCVNNYGQAALSSNSQLTVFSSDLEVRGYVPYVA